MQGEPFTVLLVEDDPAHAEIVRRNFEGTRTANTLKHVSDGQSALDYLYRKYAFSDPSSSPRPGLVLLALRLPLVDGLQVLKTIQSDPLLKKHPGSSPVNLGFRDGTCHGIHQPCQQLSGKTGRFHTVQ